MSAKKKFGSPPSGKKAAKFSDPIQDDTNNGVITGKSLAAKIAELSNPSPRDFDPEAPTDWDSLRLERYDIEEGPSSKKFQKAPTKVAMKAEPIMGEKYRGKKVSRKDLAEDNFSAEEDVMSDLDGSDDGEFDEDGDDGDNFDVVLDESSDEEEDDGDLEDKFQFEGEDEEYGSGNVVSTLKSVEEALKLQKQLEQEEEEDETTQIKALARDAKEELNKATQTKNQRGLWDSLLDVRMRIQKLLTSTNKLPQYDAYPEFVANMKVHAENEDKNVLKATMDNISGLLGDLSTLNNHLRLQHPDLQATASYIEESHEEPSENGGDDNDKPKRGVKRKRDVDEWWEEIDRSYKKFAPYQNEVIEMWHSKTMIQSGVNVSKLKNLNQSAVRQTENILKANKDKVVKKTQLKREDYSILGKITKTTTPDTKDVVLGADGEPIINTEKQRSVNAEDYDSEIFDDGDFYQMLLKELIESGMNDVQDPYELTRRYLMLNKLRKKRHRNVDRRATKGRKIKYVVHDKLVNYMAPDTARYPLLTSGTVGQLFRSLFGQKPVMTKSSHNDDDD
jgi:protein AATF/BFR2